MLTIWELTARGRTALSPLETVLSAQELPIWGEETLATQGPALSAQGLPGGTTLNQVIFPCFLSCSLLNLPTCLSLILRNLNSLTLSINCWHLSITEVDIIDASFDLLNSLCLVLSPRTLLMDLTLE